MENTLLKKLLLIDFSFNLLNIWKCIELYGNKVFHLRNCMIIEKKSYGRGICFNCKLADHKHKMGSNNV